MWPFCRPKREKPTHKIVKRLITGLIIGGAIGSVIGKRLMDKHDEEMGVEDENEED